MALGRDTVNFKPELSFLDPPSLWVCATVLQALGVQVTGKYRVPSKGG